MPHGAMPPVADEETWAHTEADLLTNVRQLVYEGARSGEGYFSTDGTRMVFQAEREPGNPFYQIYLMDLVTGDVQRVSPGHGRTTCSWIHPDGKRVLFASTHNDPEAQAKMDAEIASRASGEQRRMTFEFDDRYDIYDVEIGSTDYRNLTNARGYNAEGSWSPDGRQIVFASNRRAFNGPLSPDDQALFDRDPASLCDIYVMDADSGNVRRLTDHQGYDGGPFFSPDGRRIVWRRFNAEGTVAEIWSMNIDGSDQRQLTHLGAMCWAPFYHPSGDYIVFTTNKHGFQNFELYFIDTNAEREPVRATFTDGPDVLPVFTPDGAHLAWVTRRGSDTQAHIFIADWNDARARELLQLPPRSSTTGSPGTNPSVADLASSPDPAPRPGDARHHVETLASETMNGRRAGTPGEVLATTYVAEALAALGVDPAGSDGWFQHFEFTSGVAMEGTNALAIRTGADVEEDLDVGRDWQPLAFSRVGPVDFAEVVFAGYGIVAPADRDETGYNAYGDLDVQGKWVVVLRYLPENVTPERRQHLNRFTSLRFKATEARDRGAVGLIVVSGPSSQVKEQLVPLRFDGTVAGASIAAVSVTDAVADRWFGAAGTDLATAQVALDAGEIVPGFALPGTRIGAVVSLRQDRSSGRNVVGRLRLCETASEEVVVVGAHVDHLGRGEIGNSLARADEEGAVHPGADDNASGVAGMIEVARYLRERRDRGDFRDARRDVVFAAWSGEEIGLLGSAHFVKTYAGEETETIYPQVAANINMDMIGRMDRGVIVQGIGSSPIWRREIEKVNVSIGLPVTLSNETFLPSDATSFYLKGVPFLSAFTGAHTEHHSPRDTADRLDYDSLARIAHLMGSVAASLVVAASAPEYVKMPAPARPSGAGGRRAYLGTIPDFSDTSAVGVLLGGVAAGSPAETAGLRARDIVVGVAGQTIENLYDYQRALTGLKIGQEIEIVIERGGERVPMRIVPGSRE
jgi:Tol biopolymer transport system component